MLRTIFSITLVFAFVACKAQSTDAPASTEPRYDYQIYLTKPAKNIEQLQYYKTCEPINGHLDDSKKRVVMHDYETGNKVYIRVEYEDGSMEEFVRSPCFIDPIIL
jgi:hypothetical protein